MNEKRGQTMPKKSIPHQSQPAIAHDHCMLEGALQALDLLHEDMILRRDEARNETAREAYDEMLTVIDSLETEYQNRLDALPPVSTDHAS
jgi:hypothetical protein